MRGINVASAIGGGGREWEGSRSEGRAGVDAKRRDSEQLPKGLTDSVHNFSRELIATGLKPRRIIYGVAPIHRSTRRTAVAAVAAVALLIFRAPNNTVAD